MVKYAKDREKEKIKKIKGRGEGKKGQRARTAGREFASNKADLASIPGIPDGLLNLPGAVFEYRALSAARCGPKPKNKISRKRKRKEGNKEIKKEIKK